MNLLSFFRGRRHINAAKEWKLSLDFETTRAKYIADGSLDKSCSVSQLELRAILDSPIAIHYLITHNTEGSLLFIELVSAWNDVQECMKCAVENREKELHGLFLRHKNFAESGLLDELDKVYQGCITPGDRELVSGETLQAARRWCFGQLSTRVYEPFRSTPEFEPVHKLICDPISWVSPNSFEYFDVIAEGGFGLVMLCSKKSTGTMYAMKIQPKRRLLRDFRRDKRRVMTEMEACSLLDHPYVSKLAYGMQTSSLIMLVFPVAACGDLGHALSLTTTGCFSFQRVQFYTAEIVSALLYLHNLGMIYRDLKPENVLLNVDGHVMLTDFGSLVDTGGVLRSTFQDVVRVPAAAEDWCNFSCPDGTSEGSKGWTCPPSVGYSISTVHMGTRQGNPIATNTLQRTNTMIGTLEYMAPEIISMFAKKSTPKDGYTAAVDWWSLGILIYKIVVGKLPFKAVPLEVLEHWLPELLNMHSDSSFEDVFTALVGTVDYSVPQLSPSSVNLLQQLLTFDPEVRLGGGVREQTVGVLTPDECPVRSHSFFRGIDWVALEKKQVTPPYIPVNEVATGSQAEQRGLSFVEALFRADRLDLIDENEPCMVHSPPLNTYPLDHIMGALSAFVSSRNDQTRSRARTHSSDNPKLKVLDADQKYFYGWNYVSCDLFETSRPSVTSKLFTGIRSLFNQVQNRCSSRIAPA